MKIKNVAICIIIFFSLGGNFQPRNIGDSTQTLPEFRNVKWGTSINKVREIETARYLQSFTGFGIEALSFKGKIAGLETRIDYTFKEDKLTEGSYIIIDENTFRDNFQSLLRFLQNLYGIPEFRSGPLYTADSVWIKLTDTGLFSGPSLYWKFNNGFIGLISEKFKEEITLTILYAYNKTIEEYSTKNLVELKDFKQNR